MTKTDLIPGREVYKLLGYANRSSLTRLVQAGKLTPAFKASGKRGEQFFNRSDIDAINSSPVSGPKNGPVAGVASSSRPS